ncbi:MAG: acylneuraminate cytidylyltransferase family protein [Proteobacteria bacterium]|nr:acylneuraminate cytidylyltransferase family protein [Pseudomonadota bacterium]MBU1741204.1 acylneuraminate cytidylyltransferase family protein [Pseudomonadota bacterium]
MILGVIPARGGSKGIPRKNLRPVCGRPLIAWTIDAARNSKLLDRFVVSTEDAEIKAVAEELGAEVLDRPDTLAGDEVLSWEVLDHALEVTGADVSVLLQPTSPIRDDDLIDRVIEKFLADPTLDSMATGYEYPVYPPHGQDHRRQDISVRFVNDGSIVVSKRQAVEAGGLFGQNPGTMVTDKEQNIDIDEPFDLWLAEKVLERRLAQDPEHLRRDRDRIVGEKFGLGLHFLKACLEHLDQATARKIADQAFRTHTLETWSKTFEGLDETQRVAKMLDVLAAMPREANPDLEIIERTERSIELKAHDCAARRVFERHGLADFLSIFCMQDLEVARLASPQGRIEIEGLLSTGQEACHERWVFPEK